MDQINPYEASTDTTASAVVDRDIASAIVDFRGGIWAVIGIGVIGGVLLIALAAGFSVAVDDSEKRFAWGQTRDSGFRVLCWLRSPRDSLGVD